MASRAMKIDPKKAAGSEPKQQSQTPSSPEGQTQATSSQTSDTSAIEIRAYQLWVQRGCPIGSPEVDWFQAEEEIRGNAA